MVAQLCPCPGYRWQLSSLLLRLSVSPLCVCVSSPTLACWDRALPIPSSWVLRMACPPTQCPCGCICPPGPCPRGLPCTFLSCFTFHFRIPCRADPSPERPSPPRAHRSVARISYTSQATWVGREGLRNLPWGRDGGPFSPARQPSRCGDAADSAWALASLCGYMALEQSPSFIHLANISLALPMSRTT